MPELPASVMRMLACVDYRRTLALVAEHENGVTGQKPIGHRQLWRPGRWHRRGGADGAR
jgi:hypothetical protein